MDFVLDAFTCVAASIVLIFVPHLLKASAVINNNKHSGKGVAYDLRNPRQSVQLSIDSTPEGQFVARLQGAHQNGLEVFPIFAFSVLAAAITGVPRQTQNIAATLHVLFRALYIVVYANNTTLRLAMLRSVLWFGQIGTCGYLIHLSIQARKLTL
jgi:uncharacterized MAPEG superfamily protein